MLFSNDVLFKHIIPLSKFKSTQMLGNVSEWHAGGYGKIKYIDDKNNERLIHVHYNNVEGHDTRRITYELMKDAKVSFEIGKGHYDPHKSKQFPPQAINVEFVNEDDDDDDNEEENNEIRDNFIDRVLESPVAVPEITDSPVAAPPEITGSPVAALEICDTPITPPSSPLKFSKSDERNIMTLQMQEFNSVLEQFKSRIQHLEEENKIIKDSLYQTRTTMNLLVSNMDLMNRHAK